MLHQGSEQRISDRLRRKTCQKKKFGLWRSASEAFNPGRNRNKGQNARPHVDEDGNKAANKRKTRQADAVVVLMWTGSPDTSLTIYMTTSRPAQRAAAWRQSSGYRDTQATKQIHTCHVSLRGRERGRVQSSTSAAQIGLEPPPPRSCFNVAGAEGWKGQTASRE